MKKEVLHLSLRFKILLSDFIKKNILISESQGIDHTLIICFVALLSIGLIMITSATLDYAADEKSSPYYFITKHLIYLSMGIVLSVIISKIKLSFYYYTGF
jgi:cell division protein FtsW (lipid II flippase)